MGDEDDVQKALELLRKRDVSHTGAHVAHNPQLTSLTMDLDGVLDDHDNAGTEFAPIGPNWKKPGNFAQLPKITNHPDGAWMMHERQDQSGRYKPWLFFSKMTGEYYSVNDKGNGYLPMGVPHNPWQAPLTVRAGNASVLSDDGTKLDMSVLLPDLPRTGFLLKQPLEFMDTPASLFVLCAGVRNTGLASEFCAKRFHSAFLPKLSSKATVWYDHELVEILSEAAKALDKQLLESSACFAGCSLAVALLSGCRLVVASLGSTRCLLCRPVAVAETKRSGSSAPAASAPSWTSTKVAGGGLHTVMNQAEALRVEQETAGMYRAPVGDASDDASKIFGRSAAAAHLASMADEWEREFVRVTRATNSFAALGVTPQDIKEGANAIRKIFRRRSLIVHPDKVAETRRQQTTAVFSTLEAAVDALEGIVQIDAAAAALLAEIHCTSDEGRLAADAAVASKLLGVAEGCSTREASKAAKEKFHGPLGKLQGAARQDVERALKILEIAEESAARGSQLWSPEDAEVGVRVTRALGCKDLKIPMKFLNDELKVEIIQLGINEVSGLALVAEGAELLTDSMVARRLAEHAPARPRAAALRIAIDGARMATRGKEAPRKAISAVCAYFKGEASANDVYALDLPPAKRLKSAQPDRVRMSHILFRWAGLKGGEFDRQGMPAPTRTQAEAERELLEIAEVLLGAREPKTLGARFKAMVLKHSECSTALNVPHADLGWLEPGGAEPSFEQAAFATALGDLSDVIVTSRGAHLMYRLG